MYDLYTAVLCAPPPHYHRKITIFRGTLRERLTTFWVVFGSLATTAFATFLHEENQVLNQALTKQALIDYLTGFPDKRAIEERLRRESAMAKRTGG